MKALIFLVCLMPLVSQATVTSYNYQLRSSTTNQCHQNLNVSYDDQAQTLTLGEEINGNFVSYPPIFTNVNAGPFDGYILLDYFGQVPATIENSFDTQSTTQIFSSSKNSQEASNEIVSFPADFFVRETTMEFVGEQMTMEVISKNPDSQYVCTYKKVAAARFRCEIIDADESESMVEINTGSGQAALFTQGDVVLLNQVETNPLSAIDRYAGEDSVNGGPVTVSLNLEESGEQNGRLEYTTEGVAVEKAMKCQILEASESLFLTEENF